jgi:hypothetical protein
MQTSSTDLISPAGTTLSRTDRGRAYLGGVSLVSFASLLLELGFTRLFSVVLFYHFAFLAISIALLGLGAGGIFAYIGRDRLVRRGIPDLGMRLCLLSAASIPVALEVVLRLPVSPHLTATNFARLTAMYLASAVPFFFTGALLSTIFSCEKTRISQLYGADLFGGAAACLAIVPLLDFIGGANVILAAAMFMAIAAATWPATSRAKLLPALASLLLLIVITGNFHGKLIDIVYAKGVRRDQPWVLFSRWNAISRVEVDQVEDSKWIVIDADASTGIVSRDPSQWQDPSWKTAFMAAPPAVVNVLRPEGKFAVIGPGGGIDVLRALVSGSRDVTAIEINPIIADDIMRQRYADYSYRLYDRPEVHLRVSDGRSFIRSSQQEYDVLQMTLVDTWASTAAGAYALSENNLYTLEAFREYFNHLKPDGMIAITRWEFREPREALRVVSQAIAALRQMGIADMRDHFVVVSDGQLNVDGKAVTVLVKKSAFTAREIQLVTQHLLQNPVLSSVYLPQPFSDDRTVAAHQAAESVREPFNHLIGAEPVHDTAIARSDSREEFIARYPYNIAPVTDNAPFFFFTFKTQGLVREIFHGRGRGIDWKVNLGVVVLFMLLIVSFLAVLAFLIFPLLFSQRAKVPTTLPLGYFIAVGLGYILVEIAFIQRFVLFLGHPTYAITVVVFLMLLSSGGGSLAARRWMTTLKRVHAPLAAILAGIMVYLLLLPPLLTALVGLALPLKLLISAGLLAPLGFAMGMPFPTGLRALEDTFGGTIEWAWAMNASASVLGSVLAMFIAVNFGLTATLAGAGAAYFAAVLLTSTFKPASAPLQ